MAESKEKRRDRKRGDNARERERERKEGENRRKKTKNQQKTIATRGPGKEKEMGRRRKARRVSAGRGLFALCCSDASYHRDEQLRSPFPVSLEETTGLPLHLSTPFCRRHLSSFRPRPQPKKGAKKGKGRRRATARQRGLFPSCSRRPKTARGEFGRKKTERKGDRKNSMKKGKKRVKEMKRWRGRQRRREGE